MTPPQETEQRTQPQKPYHVEASSFFWVSSFLLCVGLAFGVGRATREYILKQHQEHIHKIFSDLKLAGIPEVMESSGLPPPVARGKRTPRTIYTSKNFDTARAAASDSLLIRSNDKSCKNTDNGSCNAYSDDEGENEEDEGEHLPAGQHLLVDMKGVDSSFLNSQERLAHAMIEVVNQARLTLLSYHCHKLVPLGVSCVGVLLESHVSFHTWPSMGVITLDLFTCGSNPLLPVVPMIERLFGVPQHGINETPRVVWAHKLRGFRPKDRHNALQQYDLGFGFLGLMIFDYKKEIASVKTDYQRIDIYDSINDRFNSLEEYQRSLSNDGSYHSKNPELFLPDRLVFLDGVMQSRRVGEAAYHEALVHPVMLAHPDPKRVAIIGGGEGATLREVLKHKTVEKAIMIEIDEEMVRVSRQYLPEWSDCSNLVGSADWCIEDPRTEMHYENAFDWFIERFAGEKKIKTELMDVIIIDALDPQDDVEFCDALYNDGKFLKSLYDSLTDDGVLMIQVGGSPSNEDPPEKVGPNKNRALLIEHLESLGFKSIHVYDESHSLLFLPWNFLVATKSYMGRKLWFRNEAEVNLALRQRAVPTVSGELPFRYFDGATMTSSYQLPPKMFQTLFCRQEPTPPSCEEYDGVDPSIPNAPVDWFEVKKSQVHENVGRGVFATRDIPSDTYIALETSTVKVSIPCSALDLIVELEKKFPAFKSMEQYMFGYGFEYGGRGCMEVTVDSTLLTFANHGCNGTYNAGEQTAFNEYTADVNELQNLLDEVGHSAFDPVLDRNQALINSLGTTLRNIQAGEELLYNYLDFGSSVESLMEDVEVLRSGCKGNAVEVMLYTRENDEDEDD